MDMSLAGEGATGSALLVRILQSEESTSRIGNFINYHRTRGMNIDLNLMPFVVDAALARVHRIYNERRRAKEEGKGKTLESPEFSFNPPSREASQVLDHLVQLNYRFSKDEAGILALIFTASLELRAGQQSQSNRILINSDRWVRRRIYSSFYHAFQSGEFSTNHFIRTVERYMNNIEGIRASVAGGEIVDRAIEREHQKEIHHKFTSAKMEGEIGTMEKAKNEQGKGISKEGKEETSKSRDGASSIDTTIPVESTSSTSPTSSLPNSTSSTVLNAINKSIPSVKAKSAEEFKLDADSPSIVAPSVAPPLSTSKPFIQADSINQPASSTIAFNLDSSTSFNPIGTEVNEEEIAILKCSSSVKPSPPPPPLSNSTWSQVSNRSSPLLLSSSNTLDNSKEDNRSMVKREDINLKKHSSLLESVTCSQDSSQHTSVSSSDQSSSLSSDVSSSLVSIQCSPITPDPTIVDTLGISFGQISPIVKERFDEIRERERLESFGIAKLSKLVSIAGAVAKTGKELGIPWVFVKEGERREVEEKTVESNQLLEQDISSSTSFDIEKQELSIATSYLENIRIFHPDHYSSATAIIAVTFAIMAEMHFFSFSRDIFPARLKSIVFKRFLIALDPPSKAINQKSIRLFTALVEVGDWIVEIDKTRMRTMEDELEKIRSKRSVEASLNALSDKSKVNKAVEIKRKKEKELQIESKLETNPSFSSSVEKIRSKRSVEASINALSDESKVEEAVEIKRKKEKELQIESKPETNPSFSSSRSILYPSRSSSDLSTMKIFDLVKREDSKMVPQSNLSGLPSKVDSSSLSSSSSVLAIQLGSHSHCSDAQPQLKRYQTSQSQMQSGRTARESKLGLGNGLESSPSTNHCNTVSDSSQVLDGCQSNQSISLSGFEKSKEDVHALSSSSRSCKSIDDRKLSEMESNGKEKTLIINPLFHSKPSIIVEVASPHSQ